MDSITPILSEFNLLSLHESSMLKLLLYGHRTLTLVANLAILTATLHYVNDTERFSND